MNDLPRLAGRIFNRPLLIEPLALDAMLAPLRARLGVEGAAPTLDLVIAPRAFSDDDERAQRQPERRRRPYGIVGGVAIVPVTGALVARAGQVTPDCTELRSYQSIEREITQAMADADVRGIVLDLDSPGGEAANVMELSARLRGLRGNGKLIVAAVNTGAYSAAYALASAADRIVLPPSGGVGSIGVVSLHVDRSVEDKQRGHKYTWIAAGARKLDGNPHAPLTDEAAQVIQAEVMRLYGIFTETVALNRAAAGMTAAKAAKTEAGLFFGDNAVRAGLADEIGGLAEAIRLAAGPMLTGRGRPSARSQTAGGKMADDDKADQSADDTTKQPDTAAITAAAQKAAQENAANIAALCQLAGVPARAAEFIAAGKTEAEVRAALLAAQAEAGQAGGEVNGTRRVDALGEKPGGNGAGMTAAQAAESWNRVGRKAFGAGWKGI